MLLSGYLLTWQTTSEGFFLGRFNKVLKFINLVAKKYVCTFWEMHMGDHSFKEPGSTYTHALQLFFYCYSFIPPCFILTDRQDSACYWPKPLEQEFTNSLVKPASHYVQSQWDFKNIQWWKRVEWKVCPQHILVEQLTSWRRCCLKEWRQVSLCPKGSIWILKVLVQFFQPPKILLDASERMTGHSSQDSWKQLM